MSPVRVAFGIAASTFLTLFVVPIFYSVVDGISHGIVAWLKRVVLGESHGERERLHGGKGSAKTA